MHAFVGEPFSLSSTKLCMETKYSPFHSLEKLQSAARLTFFPCIFNYSCLHADSLVLSRLYRTIPYTWSRRYHLDYHALVTKWDSTTIPGAFSMVPFVWWLPLPFAWCPLPFDEAPFKLGLSPCLLDAVVCEECLIAKAAFSKLLPLPFWGAPTKVLPLITTAFGNHDIIMKPKLPKMVLYEEKTYSFRTGALQLDGGSGRSPRVGISRI